MTTSDRATNCRAEELPGHSVCEIFAVWAADWHLKLAYRCGVSCLDLSVDPGLTRIANEIR